LEKNYVKHTYLCSSTEYWHDDDDDATDDDKAVNGIVIFLQNKPKLHHLENVCQVQTHHMGFFMAIIIIILLMVQRFNTVLQRRS